MWTVLEKHDIKDNVDDIGVVREKRTKKAQGYRDREFH